MLGLGVSVTACVTRRRGIVPPVQTGFRPGMNVHFIGTSGVDNVRDLGLTAVPLINANGYHYAALPGYGAAVEPNVYRAAAEYGMGNDGTIHAVPSGASGYINFIVSTRGGDVTWSGLPATANYVGNANTTIIANTIATDGKLTFRSSNGQAPILTFLPDSAALSAGIRTIGQITVAGDPSTRFLTDQARADHKASAAVSRFMEMTPYLNNIQDVAGPITSTWKGPAYLGDGKGYLSYTNQAKWCADCSTDLWVNLPDQASDAFATEAAQEVLAVAAFGGRVLIEFANEGWNYNFSQFYREVRQGIARGYHSAATKAAAVPVSGVVNTGIDYATHAIGAAGTTGQVLVANMQAGGGISQGISALRLTTNVAAGTPLVVGTNCIVFVNGDNCFEAARRYHISRSKEVAQLWQAVLGSRVVPVLGTWLGYSGGGIAAAMAWDDAHLFFKRVAPAGYFGNGNGGADEELGQAGTNWYQWSNPAKANAVADSTNNWAAARNLIFGGSVSNAAWSDTGPIAKSVDSTIAIVGTFATQMETGLQSLPGYSPNSIKLALYEAGQHIVMQGWSDMTNAAGCGKAIQDDARMGVAFARLVAGFAPVVAECCWYADVGVYGLGNDGIRAQGWGIRETQGVPTSRSQGLEAGVAGYL
jgi:hypothetical protein